MADLENQPEPPSADSVEATIGRAISSATLFRNALAHDIVAKGGTIHPMDLYGFTHVLAAEFRALRELVLDLAASEENGINEETRTRMLIGYYQRLATMLDESVTALQSAPKIHVATEVRSNGLDKKLS